MNAFANDLAAFELRGGARRTEDAQWPRDPKTIDDAAIERQLGTDDREIDAFAFGKRRERVGSPALIAAIRRDAGDARHCPARTATSLTAGSARQFPGERVLAAAAADDQHFHDAVS